MGLNGRVVIPASMREALNLKTGDALVATVEGKRLVLATESALLRQLYNAAGSPEGELASDELIRERREEARREAAHEAEV